jgi:murein L,D-transpeptidase YcbB/YkuD
LLAVVTVVGLLGATAACGGDGEVTSVSAAEANVAAKEQALADATAASTAADAAFCDASASYITAIDRYGDVLTQTTVTVGDVRTAGKDLAEPADETLDAGQSAASARESVTKAESELADAQASLAAAQAAAASEAPPEPTADEPETSSEEPASIAQVQKAEEEFEDAQKGITETTPLEEAAEQFNAAAVGLEMAWLQAFGESGCLSDDQRTEAAAAVKSYTKALQKSLTTAGYYKGDIDGIYGPQTVAAVEDLQKDSGLPVTGTVDKATDAALRTKVDSEGAAEAEEALATTAALQQTLKIAGYWDGPVDGEWSDALTEALKAAQTDLGVEATGEVDAATLAAFQQALEDLASPAASEEPTEMPTEEVPVEPSPTQTADEG